MIFLTYAIILGDIDVAMKSMSNYHDVLKLYGFTPEVYNVVNQESARDSFPLRPELVESAMYLYKATSGDPYLLDIGSDILRSIQHSSRTRCGYATVIYIVFYFIFLRHSCFVQF